MSSVYVTEPPSSGKVVVHTTLGSLDIELWPKEAPLACRNFCQLCMEGYYDDVIFHRVIKDFMAQTGDPTGTGAGGESVYGHPFKDEYHQRLKFNRRGLIAMANLNADDTNTSQFFISLGACPWLDRKHTIFGKVVGNSAFNALKFQDISCDAEDRPLAPPKVLSTEVLDCPFDDIVPRESRQEQEAAVRAVKEVENQKALSVLTAKSRKRDLNLVSFDDDEEEEEEEELPSSKRSRRRMRSAFDVVDDSTERSGAETESCVAEKPLEPKTENSSSVKRDGPVEATAPEVDGSSVVATTDGDLDGGKRSDGVGDSDNDEDGKGDITAEQTKATQREASRAKKELERAEKRERKRRAKELKLVRDQARDDALARVRPEHRVAIGESNSVPAPAPGAGGSVMSVVEQRRRQFLDKKKKTQGREANTLAMLNAFKSKLSAAVAVSEEGTADGSTGDTHGNGTKSKVKKATAGAESYKGGIGENPVEGESDEDDEDGAASSWMTKELVFKRQHMDANARTAEDYTLIDPRTETGKREMAQREQRGRGGRDKGKNSNSHSRSSRQNDSSSSHDRRTGGGGGRREQKQKRHGRSSERTRQRGRSR